MSSIRFVGWCACCLMVLASLSGCISASSSRVTVQDSTKISKGQELSDLVRARQLGALTEDEYNTVRSIIMKRPN